MTSIRENTCYNNLKIAVIIEGVPSPPLYNNGDFLKKKRKEYARAPAYAHVLYNTEPL